MGLHSGGLIIGRIFASKIWFSYFGGGRGLFLEGLIVGILRYFIAGNNWLSGSNGFLSLNASHLKLLSQTSKTVNVLFTVYYSSVAFVTPSFYFIFFYVSGVIIVLKNFITHSLLMQLIILLSICFNCFVLGGVKFELLESSDCLGAEQKTWQCFLRGVNGPVPSVCVELHSQPIPLTELLCRKLIDKFPDHSDYKLSWPSLLGKLAKGELIYPWVKPRNSK